MTVLLIIKELDAEISRLREVRNLLSTDGRSNSDQIPSKINSKPRTKRKAHLLVDMCR
jgi:hypothetical protein